MEQTIFHKVNAIPKSKYVLRKKGESKYGELMEQIMGLPVGQAFEIKHPEFKVKNMYNSLLMMLSKSRRTKQIRLALRDNGKRLYAEKMFE